MQRYCRGGFVWCCVVLVGCIPAVGHAGYPPTGVSFDGQDKISEGFEKQLGVEEESRKPEDDNLWVEYGVPETQYNYWETGREVTDTGKKEAEQASDITGKMPEMHAVLPKERGNLPCDGPCAKDEYCWEGTCLYRPWKYQSQPKFSCYPNPSQPGLTLEEKLKCRVEKLKYDGKACKKTKYCSWLSDMPMWYKPFYEHWEPPPPSPPPTLTEDIINAGKTLATAVGSTRDVSGAEPLTPALQRANDRDEFVGGTNKLPYNLRTHDDLRTWDDRKDNEPLKPMVIDIKSDEPKPQYPTNTTGPRFLANATNPYWYATKSNQEKFEDMDEAAEEAAEKAAEEAEAEKAAAAPAPAPAPAPLPAPAPSPAASPMASPAFLEIRHIQEHPFV